MYLTKLDRKSANWIVCSFSIRYHIYTDTTTLFMNYRHKCRNIHDASSDKVRVRSGRKVLCARIPDLFCSTFKILLRGEGRKKSREKEIHEFDRSYDCDEST